MLLTVLMRLVRVGGSLSESLSLSVLCELLAFLSLDSGCHSVTEDFDPGMYNCVLPLLLQVAYHLV